MMSSTVLCAVILLACAVIFGAAQSSCKGQCGAEYYRGNTCQCDYNCLSYGECCKDYESKCTTKDSCKGRCGEPFKRGRLCSCDSECIKYKQCCPDYKTNCDAVEDIPTSHPSDEPSDDLYSQVIPNAEFSNNGPEEANPASDGTSGYGSSTADLQDQVSTEPTLKPNTAEFSAETITDASDPISSSHPGTALPQPTAAVDHVSSQPSPTSAPQTGVSPTAITPEPVTAGEAKVQAEDDIFPQKTEPTEASSDGPEVTTLPVNTATSASTGVTQDYKVPEKSQGTTISDSSTLNPTPIPDATTSIPQSDDTEKSSAAPTFVLPDLLDPFTSVSPRNLSDAMTTLIPSSKPVAQADVKPQGIVAEPTKVTPDVTKPQPSKPSTSKPQDKPYKPSPTKLTTAKPNAKPEAKPVDTAQTLNVDDPRDYQADDSNDTNLCSGRPVGAVTTLRNGTVVVFRGHYFWFLDRNRVPGPARGITQVWGVPSPIDTVFTRCNCQGKTYIFKGALYWRFENDVLDPGYPKIIETGFDGLQGHITAALSVPQHRQRRESVYFFKRGGLVQKYSYQFGTSPSCGRKVHYAIYTVRNRSARQAVSLLGPAINIQTSFRGFPPTITAAVSIPNSREPEGYKYYVFSGSKSYNVRMDGERPQANASPQSNDLFKCPKKV